MAFSPFIITSLLSFAILTRAFAIDSSIAISPVLESITFPKAIGVAPILFESPTSLLTMEAACDAGSVSLGSPPAVWIIIS